MKYKDYYACLGVDSKASTEVIKKAYRKLALKHHPDVSKAADAEERFKDISEAYKTLKDPEKREAYDQLGQQKAGQPFEPAQDWKQEFGDGQFSFDESELADLFAGLRGGSRRTRGSAGGGSQTGRDFEVTAEISLHDAYHGNELALQLMMPEYDASGRVQHVARTVNVRVPKGATDGQRLRVPGKGGAGFGTGKSGDLYLNIALHGDRLFRVSGRDVYVDLPLTPSEAVLGAQIEVPTPTGNVRLTIPAGTQTGRQLRLAKRGIPNPKGGAGDLLVLAQIVVPGVITARERELYEQLATASEFNPRAHFDLDGAST